MLQHRILSVAAGAALLFAGAGPVTAPPAPTPAASTLGHEPMVMYNVTGGTLTGTVHRQLTVYNSGFVTIAKFDNAVFPTPGEFKDVRTASIGPQAALQLLIDLVVAGAATLPDQRFVVPDVPLNTLTILEGRELALSRTFSYSIGGKYTGVSTVINSFVQNTFPGF